MLHGSITNLEIHFAMTENDTENTPAELRRLAKDENPVVRRHVAKNPNTPAETLWELLDDEDSWIAWNLAQNPAAPVELFQELVVRGRFLGIIAANRKAPKEILTQLASVDDWNVVAEVGKNPSTPLEVIAKLAKSSASAVRWYVARNTSATPEVLESLASDPDERVRRSVARNRNTPKPLKASLKQALGM